MSNFTVLATLVARPAAAVVSQAASAASGQLLSVASRYCSQILVAGAALVGTAIAYVSPKSKSSDEELQELVTQAYAGTRAEARQKLETFIERHWDRLDLPASAKNAVNKRELIAQLATVLVDDIRSPAAVRVEKTSNIIKTFISEAQLQQLVIETRAARKAEALQKIEAFIEKYWSHLSLPDAARNEHNKKVLRGRLGRVLCQVGATELKFIKCKNISHNFTAFLQASCQTIEGDLRNDRSFLSKFGLREGDTLACVKLLGEETHNRGQVPLLVEFSNGKKVVFKPRSMVTEELICGREVSLLKSAGLHESTYHVHDKETYGYAQWLENNENENTCADKAEVETYLAKFGRLDAFARALGISDLHMENVVTRNKAPVLIDTEVVRPTDARDFSTDLLRGSSAGYLFGAHTKNRIWFAPALKAMLTPETEDMLGKSCCDGNDTALAFQEMGVLRTIEAFGARPVALSPRDAARAEETRRVLARYNHRIVLIGTFELQHFISAPLDKSPDAFLERLEEEITANNYVLDRSQLAAIKERFIQDVQNNDVPLFHYNPSKGEIYYHNLIIAKKKP